VGVDLRGADVGVPEQLLDGAQVAAGLEQMGGEGMPQHVRMHRPVQALPARPVVESGLNGAVRQPPAAATDEQPGLFGVGQGMAHRHPVGDRLAGLAAHRHDPGARALAHHPQFAGPGAGIIEVEGRHLGQPQAGPVDQFEQRPVAALQRIRGLPGGLIGAGRWVEQLGGGVDIEGCRQAACRPRCLDVGRGIGVHAPFALEITEQPAHRGELTLQGSWRQAAAVVAADPCPDVMAAHGLPGLDVGLLEVGRQPAQVTAIVLTGQGGQAAFVAQMGLETFNVRPQPCAVGHRQSPALARRRTRAASAPS